MLHLKYIFKVKFRSVVIGCLLYRNDIISVCGGIPIEIPILWPRAVMVGPRPRVHLTLPLPAYAVFAMDNYTMQICESSSQNGDPMLLSQGKFIYFRTAKVRREKIYH